MMESILVAFLVVLSLSVGYVIGLLQNGININHKGIDAPEEYNSSVGHEDYMDYFDKHVEVRENRL